MRGVVGPIKISQNIISNYTLLSAGSFIIKRPLWVMFSGTLVCCGFTFWSTQPMVNEDEEKHSG